MGENTPFAEKLGKMCGTMVTTVMNNWYKNISVKMFELDYHCLPHWMVRMVYCSPIAYSTAGVEREGSIGLKFR